MNIEKIKAEAERQGLILTNIEKVKVGDNLEYMIGYDPATMNHPRKTFKGIDETTDVPWYRFNNGSYKWLRMLNLRQIAFLEKALRLQRKVNYCNIDDKKESYRELHEWLECAEASDIEILETQRGRLLKKRGVEAIEKAAR